MAKNYPAENGFTKLIVLLILLIIGECVSCPTHCSFCNSTEYCFVCDTGYKGANCSEHCDNCKPDTKCTKGDGFCVVACKDGLGGMHCNKPCASNCKSCLRNDINRCSSCINRQTCELVCPDDCLSQFCKGSKEEHCNNGCPPGYWGDSCTNRCPEDCNADQYGNGVQEVADEHEGTLPVLKVLLLTLPGVLLVLLVVVVLVVLWKRQRSRHQDNVSRTCRSDLWTNTDNPNDNRVAQERSTTFGEVQGRQRESLYLYDRPFC